MLSDERNPLQAPTSSFPDSDMQSGWCSENATGFRMSLSPEAVPLLVSALDDDQQDYRLLAIEALVNIHSDPDRTVPALVKCLDDPAPRVNTVYGLRELGPMAHAAVPKLTALLKDEKDPAVSDLYRSALRKIDPNSDPAASGSGDSRAAHP